MPQRNCGTQRGRVTQALLPERKSSLQDWRSWAVEFGTDHIHIAIRISRTLDTFVR
jgi:hypothetical protein